MTCLSQNLNYTLLDINYLSSSECFILLFLNTVSGSDTKTILCIYVFFRRSKCTNTAIKCAFSGAYITMIKHWWGPTQYCYLLKIGGSHSWIIIECVKTIWMALLINIYIHILWKIGGYTTLQGNSNNRSHVYLKLNSW